MIQMFGSCTMGGAYRRLSLLRPLTAAAARYWCALPLTAAASNLSVAPTQMNLQNGRLFIAFLPGAMDGFFANIESAVAAADARWATWWADDSSAEYGVFNSLCLGPPARWALHSCSRSPQSVSGVPSIPPVSDECLVAVDKACGAVSPAKTGVILGHACSDCLDENSALLISGGRCPNDGVGDLAGIVDKVYCK